MGCGTKFILVISETGIPDKKYDFRAIKGKVRPFLTGFEYFDFRKFGVSKKLATENNYQ